MRPSFLFPLWRFFSIPLALILLGLPFGTGDPGRSLPAAPQAALQPAAKTQAYYPGPGADWERREPEEVGMRASRLEEAIAFAKEQESPDPRDLARFLAERNARESHNDIIGPTRDRGPTNGLVIRHGYIVAEFGDTERVDMTFSVTKSFLSAVAGLAFDRSLIQDVHDPVRKYVADGGFDSPHNAPITWHHLLQQTSEWEGTLWGKPETADRRRGASRSLQQPGSFWEYNDVRVNRLSLSLLRVWRKPLPRVLKDEVMDPIGASDTWQWHGYRNSLVEMDGAKMISVSGGGHWGGGLWISSRDQARFGYLYLRRGKWKDRQILSEKWFDLTRTPCPIRSEYGYLWWLNTDRKLWPSAPESSFAARGAGSNLIWVDPDHDLVVVLRWIRNDQSNAILKRVMEAINPSATETGRRNGS